MFANLFDSAKHYFVQDAKYYYNNGTGDAVNRVTLEH